MFNLFWINVISHEESQSSALDKPLAGQIKRRKLTWIGRAPSKDSFTIQKQASRWNPQGQRGREVLRRNCKVTTEEEAE
jgi:hypothetical protein